VITEDQIFILMLDTAASEETVTARAGLPSPESSSGWGCGSSRADARGDPRGPRWIFEDDPDKSKILLLPVAGSVSRRRLR